MQYLGNHGYIPKSFNGYNGFNTEKNDNGLPGALYGKRVEDAVKKFQKNKKLKATGVVDLTTWKKMGYSEKEWKGLELYVYPTKRGKNDSKKECIETMIDTAYEYYNKGTKYVLGGTGAPGTRADCLGLVYQSLYSTGLDMGAKCNPVQYCHVRGTSHKNELGNLWHKGKMLKINYKKNGIERGDVIVYSHGDDKITHYAIALNTVKNYKNCKVIEAYSGGIYKNIPIIVNGTKAYTSNNGEKHYVDHDYIVGVMRPFQD